MTTTYPTDEEWTPEQQSAALAEGWNLWDCDGSANGRTQLCTYDDKEDCPQAARFADDTAAWKYVVARAVEGSDLHLHALKVVAAHNPTEAASIEAATGFRLKEI